MHKMIIYKNHRMHSLIMYNSTCTRFMLCHLIMYNDCYAALECTRIILSNFRIYNDFYWLCSFIMYNNCVMLPYNIDNVQGLC